MKLNLFVALCICFLTACGKQHGTASNEAPKPEVAQSPTEKKYPTVDEAELKGVARTRFDSPNPTEAQIARREKNNKIIAGMGLPVMKDLPVVEDEKAVRLRSPEEIAKRCLATTFCAVKGETKDQKFVDSLIKDYSASGFLSPEERRFIKNAKPSEQELVDFSWRYECVHVFLWAMGARETLSPPNDSCPVPEDMDLIKKTEPGKFVAESKRRSPEEILDMADLYYRLHWAAIELRLKGAKSEKLDEGVVSERHRALNWLMNYLNQDWDHVTTDT